MAAAKKGAAFDRSGSISTLSARTDPGCTRQVWAALRTIPAGVTWSYRRLAERIGRPAAVGAVGLANGANPVLALAVAGALVGFLAWNLPPARVFLGNGGAYGLGALLTVLAAQATLSHGWHGLLAAALCLGVFAFELTFTVVRRLLSSQRLATGDRRHSYDLLGRSRGNRDRSTLALWTLAAVSAGAGYASDQVSLAAAGTMIGVAFVIGTAAGGRLWRDAVAVAEPQQPTERP